VRFFYDTEFVENGRTIELVSIGMVAEDGREFYAVSSEFDVVALHRNPWLVKNVWPSLPHTKGVGGRRCRCGHGHLDVNDPAVRPRAQIARAIQNFLLTGGPDPELWADYGAYDHVALCQLYGSMANLPAGMPMWTHDLRQLVEQAGNPDLPEQTEGLHNALEDARHVRSLHNLLIAGVDT
jgi:hypothetical protein